MSIEEKQRAIIDEFSMFDDWMEKYEYIIDLGKDLPQLSENQKDDTQIIEGCQSRVWLKSEFSNDKMSFLADSDAIITKGIIALLIQVLNNETPQNIASSNLFFIDEIGLKEHLSPTRANGLLSMVKRMKMDAIKMVNSGK
ncbi:MAG: SufE family protein [Bacteroidota bacterium]